VYGTLRDGGGRGGRECVWVHCVTEEVEDTVSVYGYTSEVVDDEGVHSNS